MIISLFLFTAAKCGPSGQKHKIISDPFHLDDFFYTLKLQHGFHVCMHKATGTLPTNTLFWGTCKLLVAVATTTKLSDELASQLKDEDGTCLVVNNDHMTILVH